MWQQRKIPNDESVKSKSVWLKWINLGISRSTAAERASVSKRAQQLLRGRTFEANLFADWAWYQFNFLRRWCSCPGLILFGVPWRMGPQTRRSFAPSARKQAAVWASTPPPARQAAVRLPVWKLLLHRPPTPSWRHSPKEFKQAGKRRVETNAGNSSFRRWAQRSSEEGGLPLTMKKRRKKNMLGGGAMNFAALQPTGFLLLHNWISPCFPS